MLGFAKKTTDVLKRAAEEQGALTLARTAEGFEGLALADILVRRAGRALFIARDDRRAEAVAGSVARKRSSEGRKSFIMSTSGARSAPRVKT